MPQEQQATVLSRSIQRLTLAAWAIAAALLLQLLMSTAPLLFPGFFLSRLNEMHVSEVIADDMDDFAGSVTELTERLDGFFKAPVEEKIERASVIALISFEESQDGTTRAYVSKILKRTPGTMFNYEVGDDYQSERYNDGRERTGVLVFFVGSPARMVYSTTISRPINSLEDIPSALSARGCTKAEAAALKPCGPAQTLPLSPSA